MSKKTTKKEKPVIGWREWVFFPELKKVKIKAKIDTGARTASIHAYDIKIITKNGQKKARFEIHPKQNNQEDKVIVEAPIVDFRAVKSSNGLSEKRPVIETSIELLGEKWPIEITLANRDMMGFRMLLGRSSIHKRFMVDVSRSFLGNKTERSKK